MEQMAAASMSNVMFTCSNPRHPSMRTFESRIKTYLHTWPNKRTPTPYNIAKAGFFSLSVGDRVKCFYCNGGLQNWRAGDDPWREHAKWYPNCEFLLQHKGIEYVEQISAMFPDINRPQSLPSTSQQASISSTPTTSLTRPNAIVVADDASTRHCKNDMAQFMQSQLVEDAKRFGFTDETVLLCVNQKFRRDNRGYTTLENFVCDLQKCNMTFESSTASDNVNGDDLDGMDLYSANDIVPTDNDIIPSPTTSGEYRIACQKNNASLSSVVDVEVYKREVESIKDEIRCKVCLDRDSNCVMQPCGHACCCTECVGGLRLCPICRTKIEQAFKFYRK